MEELNNCQQGHNENITNFYHRLETLNSRVLSAAQQYTTDTKCLPGKIQSINEITLNRFVYLSNPQISQMLRWREFDNINSAFTAALTEEKALNIQYHSKQFCKICKKTNHDSRNCKFKNNDRSINFVQDSKQENSKDSPNQNSKFHSQSFQNQNSYQSKYCKYCKRKCHLIHECRKRQAKNHGKTQTYNSEKENPVHLNSQ